MLEVAMRRQSPVATEGTGMVNNDTKAVLWGFNNAQPAAAEALKVQ